jgi:hypothetical protein
VADAARASGSSFAADIDADSSASSALRVRVAVSRGEPRDKEHSLPFTEHHRFTLLKFDESVQYGQCP